MKERPLKILTLLVVIFTSISALAGGFGLLKDPTGTGRALRMSTQLLDGTVFHSFIVPGILLFVIIGVGNLVDTFILLKKPDFSWGLTMILGGALVTWILVQVCLIGYVSVLQPIYFIIGVFEFVLGFSLIKYTRRTIKHSL